MEIKKLEINISEEKKQIPLYIGKDILGKISELFILSKYSRIVVLTDKNIKETRILEELNKGLSNYKNTALILSPGEKAKNIRSVENIWSFFLQNKIDRKSLVINLGGGVICDMGAFASSTYMRGIDFLQIPTTVTAQVDASLGGKTGIDYLNTKNLIGTFNQPVGIINDVSTLKSLPERIFVEGFAEIIKHGLILDKNYFSLVTSKKPREFTEDELVEIIEASCLLKKNIVEKDEKEQGGRKILNFGHTIGHALEAISFNKETLLLHGEAVNLGMIVETKISVLSGLLKREEGQKIKKKLSATGLPSKIHGFKISEIMDKISTDKKKQNSQIHWTLLNKIGQGVVDKIVEDQIVSQSIREILN